MIYAGLLKFGSLPLTEKNLQEAVESFTQDSPSVIRKGSLVLCYGKLSNLQDMDAVWENALSLLIGRVFDKENSFALRKETFRELSLLNGEEILEKVWGKYVYINANETATQFNIVIDSTGQLPFFYYPFPDGSLLFASDIDILFKVLRQKPEYNWDYLCSYLVYGNNSSIQTPFKNVFELPPACSLQITKNERKTTPFWNPLSFYRNEAIQEYDTVNVLQKTLRPWIEPYQSVCVSLSGGLDSSSLVYCLKDIIKKNQTLTALNYFHSQIKSSNELEHARKVCEETGIDLIEVDVSNSLPFDSPRNKQPLKPNKPFAGMVSLRWLETILAALPDNESFTFISGHGSDHIFMRPPSKKALSDYIIEKGLQGSTQELKNLSQFYRDSFFPIIKENVTSLFSYVFGRKKDRVSLKEKLKDIPSWINKEMILKVLDTHPIYNNLSSKVLPGKYEQIDALYEGIASIHLELMHQADPAFYPFLYQPIVEFALSFPTYKLFDEGYDRYPLRKAVNDNFKTETVWRRDKGQTTGLFQLGVKKNLERVLDICLEGYFVKQGYIDKKGLHQTIIRIGNGDVKNLWAFMHLASLEIFLRFWEERSL
ncbi:asparagine synthase-related protein [Candidatus Paracaedibacter symbiosus]|uniref:asparagine synthase-related protein n=1 Tax=Candidatus Paracaedibacter symbiosus TaxID=244582 RepID=UPI0005093F14|nr:asparagine synthase-related protein [Candidatus Paracaedibacter symbiosus]